MSEGGTPLLSSMTFRNSGMILAETPPASLAHLQIGLDEGMHPWYDTELSVTLQSTPALKSLIFQHDLSIHEDISVDRIHIPSLLSLVICCPLSCYGRHIGRLFVLIEASNLESLILDFPHHGEISTFINSFRETPLSVKFPQLKTLTLQLHRVQDDLLADITPPS
jgi:hypothetical protein